MLRHCVIRLQRHAWMQDATAGGLSELLTTMNNTCHRLMTEQTKTDNEFAKDQFSLAFSKHHHRWMSSHIDNDSTKSIMPAGDSTSSPQQERAEQHKHEPLSQDVEYHGPLSQTHKLLKRISISNTLIALIAAPFIVEYADVSYVSRIGLAASLVMFGLLTTGALHWVAHPYVHLLKYKAATKELEATMTTLLGFKRVETFQLSDVRPLPWNRPVATFMAKDKFYYIDVYSFPDEDLLKLLTPPEDTVPPGYKDDDD